MKTKKKIKVIATYCIKDLCDGGMFFKNKQDLKCVRKDIINQICKRDDVGLLTVCEIVESVKSILKV